MAGVQRSTRTVLSAAVVAAQLALLAAAGMAVPDTAQAQFFRDDRYAPANRRPQRSPGFFEQLFGGGNRGVPADADRLQQVESSRAPAAKKSETPPTLTVTVMGDSMADWLAYGLEEAFADAPEIGIIRKTKTGSGLLRYEARSDLDWWHVARDLLAQEKTDYVVMMMGLNDRQPIRESQLQKAADKAAKEKEQAAKEQNKDASKPDDPEKKADDDDDQPSIMSPERPRSTARGVIEFRSDRWEEIYGKRIDETIAALKSKGVPVLWVGLPPVRGTRSTAEAGYLNDLFRARAEKAGIVFVDVWDGFVDEQGKFTSRGPDFEGQIRLLRSGDGAHFTKAGARKLAHYVERDLRRYMTNRALPVALPSGPGVGLPAGPQGPTVRPLAGPVLPLTSTPGGSEELLGGGGTRPVHADPTATRVLVKGEPVPAPVGRADNFSWPRPGEAANSEPLSPAAAAARATVAPASVNPAPAKDTAKNAEKPGAKGSAKDTSGKKQQDRTAARNNAQQPAPQGQPRPPAQVQRRAPPPQQPRRDGGPFGWLR